MQDTVEKDAISRDEFRDAAAATIASVHHFYREVGRLYSSLRDTLQAEPNPLVAIGGLAARASRTGERTNVRNWYGELFETNLDDGEAGDDEFDTDEDDEESPKKKGAPVILDSLRSLLVVKLKLYDPTAGPAAEPELQYAVIGDWSRGTAQPASGQGQQLVMAAHMLRRIVRAFEASAQEMGQRVTTKAMVKAKQGTKAVDKQVSYRVLTRPQRVALFELDSSDALDRVGREIQNHWASSAGSQA